MSLCKSKLDLYTFHFQYRSLDEVNDDVIQHFLPSAKELIESRGAENALAAALAFISGTTEVIARSMLTSQTVM